MGKKYSCALVALCNGQEDIDLIRENISQTNSRNNIQIIAVVANPSEQIKRYNNVIYIYAMDNIVENIKQSIDAEFVSFILPSVSYDKNAFTNVVNLANKHNYDVVFANIQSLSGINRILRNYCDYCGKYKAGMTFDTDIKIMHNLYFAYFFRTNTFSWLPEMSVETWVLDVLKMVYKNVLTHRHIGCISKRIIYIKTGNMAIELWNDEFNELSRLAFTHDFVKGMLAIRNSGDILFKINADYTLLYYCIRISNLISNHYDVIDEDVRVAVANLIDGFLSTLYTPNIIINNVYISRINKYFLLNKYFRREDLEESEAVDRIFEKKYTRVVMNMFEIKDEGLYLEYSFNQPLNDWCTPFIMVNHSRMELTREVLLGQTRWCGELVGETYIYSVTIPYDKLEGMLRLGLDVKGKQIRLIEAGYSKYTPFTLKAKLFKVVRDKVLFIGDDERDIFILDNTEKNIDKLIRRRTGSFMTQGTPGIKAIAARKLYEQRKEKLDKNIWLFSDRTNRGDDNGEVLFQYVCENPIDGVEPYFVVDEDTDDWNRMQKFGKVVAPFSREHKLLFLLNEYSLSSQANAAVVNPFGKYEYLYRDLMYDKKLVFLQHGITKDNQSKWLNKYNRNLYGFIVTTKPEYDSVFEYDYYYKPEKVWLTGMPRYDRLYHDEKNYITVMPTWRKSLSAGTDEKGVWILGDEFKDSEYFKFYNDLLNDERLLKAADEYGYKVCFMPHPNTIAGIDMFDHNPKVEFMDMSFSYRDIFAQTDLMVTDYSSVAFDFAYLRKPIVYAQFDKESFFNGEHSYTEGYFDYERDGFGEVEYTLDTVINRVIEYMKTGCTIKPEYEQRINNTFAFNDKNCCKRVIEFINKYRKMEKNI